MKFDFPVTDHPDNPFGIDLIVFGNTGFIDLMWPSAVVGGVFGNDGGIVEVSADGTTWHVVRDAEADGLFPSVGYLDSGPYDLRPGAVESDFRKPVDPTLALKDFLGLGFSAVLDLYDGSGGGAGIDIGATGLSQISYVRVSNPVDAFASVEIDGFAKVRPTIHGDLNGDGVVNIFDLLVVLASWGPCPEPPAGCPADLDESGVVNVFDLLIVLQNWG